MKKTKIHNYVKVPYSDKFKFGLGDYIVLNSKAIKWANSRGEAFASLPKASNLKGRIEGFAMYGKRRTYIINWYSGNFNRNANPCYQFGRHFQESFLKYDKIGHKNAIMDSNLIFIVRI